MPFYMIVIIAISLSMDAFSLSLAYGTKNITIKDKLKLTIIVGIFHLFMPLLGYYFGSIIFNLIKINPKIIVMIILLIIGIGMISDTFSNEEKEYKLKLTALLLFGLAVSIDSFSVGIGLKVITNNSLLSATIFSITSAIFTFLGLTLGNILSNFLGKTSTILGGITLIIIGISYLF